MDFIDPLGTCFGPQLESYKRTGYYYDTGTNSDEVSVSKECRINLAKMWDCSLCSGEPQAKPCSGLCTNVMKGCLADWAEVSVSKECRINLAKMWDCSLCSGEPQAKPCSGLCTNVMKGCLADWAEVGSTVEFYAMVKMSARLRGPQNLHQALQPLPVQLSEAVMEMQERSVTVSNKVGFSSFWMVLLIDID
ncbi:hypothetical protein COOONC_11977 [Cooperia oncophora]